MNTTVKSNNSFSQKLKSVHEETKSLPSYYVKTIFLWALDDKSLDQNMWTQWSDGALFMFVCIFAYIFYDYIFRSRFCKICLLCKVM